MTVEAAVWNKNSSSWRDFVDSATISVDVGTNHQVSFNLTGSINVPLTGAPSAVIGYTTQIPYEISGSANTAALQVVGDTAGDSMIAAFRFGANANAARLVLGKSRGASEGSQGAVQNSDQLGIISFGGSDGDAITESATIHAVISGTPGTDDLPTDLVFSTSADGGKTVAEGFRLTSDKNLKAIGQGYFTQATLTDGATINWNLNTEQCAQVTLGGNRTLAAPTNQKAGATYILLIKQDGTGSRTLAFNSTYKFPGGTDPTLSTGANDVDLMTCYSDGTNMYCSVAKDFS